MDEQQYLRAERAVWAHWGPTPTEHRVDVRGARLRVQEVGAPDGQPLLFVHGASVAGTCWADLASRLPDHRCLLLDRPGCGLSEPLASVAGITDLADLADGLVAEVLDGLSVNRAQVVSNSMGGLFALRGAAAAPDRVTAVVHFGWALGAPPVDRLPLIMRTAGAPGIGRLFARMPMTRTAVRFMFRQTGLGAALADGRIPDVGIDWNVALGNHTDTRVNEYAMVGSDLVEQMARLAIPDDVLARVPAAVRIVLGTGDPFTTPATMQRLADGLPAGSMEVWEGAGHAAWLDDLDRSAAVVRSVGAST